MTKRLSLFTLFSLVLFLAACQQSAEPTQIPAIDTDGNISVAATQFVSLRFLMEQDGVDLATAQSLYMTSLLAEDIHGKSLIYITFVAPVPIGNPYEFGISLDDDYWIDQQYIFSWSTHFRGARDTYGTTSSVRAPLIDLVNIANTVQNIGGEANLKRLVALMGDTLVETSEGTFVDVTDGRIISAAEITEATRAYDTLVRQIENDDVGGFPARQQQWRCEFDSNQCPLLDPYSFDIAALTKTDGTLDIPAAAAEIQRQLIDP
ncbi:MAG: hypothetical protein AAF708_03970 [Deinococcota bacterium]